MLILFFGMYVQKYSCNQVSGNQQNKVISEAKGVTGIIISEAKNTAKTERYLLRIDQLKFKDSLYSYSANVLLYLSKSEENISFDYGDRIFANVSLAKIQGPKNPEDFDYAKFMRRKGYEFQAFAKNDDLIILNKNNGSKFMDFAIAMRNYFQSVLKENFRNPDNFHIAEALILGQKDDLPNDVRSAFADAGAIHVLAVSGLHVGIIYQMLIYILSFLKRWKYGSTGIFFISVFILFGYALITGFSPSVSRAVIMFSILALSKLINRRSNIYNNLGLAAFIILIIDPMMIFDLGFQLSFLAVFSIVFFYPYLTSTVEINNSILDKMYKLTCVSLAAQIGTFPITIYYFHQFPNFFILSNFIVIPFAAIILTFGIALLVLHFFPLLENLLAWLLEMSINIMNRSIFIIQELPYSVTKDIYYDHWHLIFSVFILSSLMLVLIYREKRFVFGLLTSICLLAGYQWYLHYSFSKQSELVLFSSKNRDYIAILDGRYMQINFDLDEKEQSDFWKYSLSAYTRERAVSKIIAPQEHSFAENSVLSSWFWNGQILIKPKENCHLTQSPDWVLIDSENAKMVLESDFNPVKGFILGNNIPFFIRSKIIEKLKERNSAFHDLKSEGALVLK